MHRISLFLVLTILLPQQVFGGEDRLKSLTFFLENKYEEADEALDILKEMDQDIADEISSKNSSLLQDKEKCQSDYSTLECEKTSSWNDSITLANNSITLLEEDIANQNNEILSLQNQSNTTKAESNEKIKDLRERIGKIKADLASIRRINKKFLRFCLKNHSLIEQGLEFSSGTMQSFVQITLRSLVQEMSPQETNRSVQNMFKKQRETFKKILDLLKGLKANLKSETKKLRAEISQEKTSLKAGLIIIDKGIEEKKGKIAEMQRKIDENNQSIRLLQKKIEDCGEGLKAFQECRDKIGNGQKFLADLKEEQQLLYNLMDLMVKLV